MWLYSCDRLQPHTAIRLSIGMLKALKTRLIRISYVHKLVRICTYKYSINMGTYIQTSNHLRAVLGCVIQRVRSRQNAKIHTQQAFQGFDPGFKHAHIHKCDRLYAHTFIGYMHT